MSSQQLANIDVRQTIAISENQNLTFFLKAIFVFFFSFVISVSMEIVTGLGTLYLLVKSNTVVYLKGRFYV